MVRASLRFACAAASLLVGTSIHAQTNNWTSGGGANTNFSDNSNWTTTPNLGNSTDNLGFDLTVLLAPTTATVDNPDFINSLVVNGGTSGNSLTVNGASPLYVQSSVTITGSGSSAVTFATTLGGNMSLTTSGTTLTLDAANIFSGNFTVNSGTIVVGNNAALGGGTFSIAGGSGITATVDGAFVTGKNISMTGTGNVFLMQNTSDASLTFGGQISGTNNLEIAYGGLANTVGFTAQNNFTGNLIVDSGGTNLVLGASTSYGGPPGPGAEGLPGALGAGSVMLGSETNLETIDSNEQFEGNDIALCGPITVFGNESGGTLELDGVITGASQIEVVASQTATPNTLVLTNKQSTFNGLKVDAGNTSIVAGDSSIGTPDNVTSGPLGSGTVMLSSGNNLSTLGDSLVTIDNTITLCGGGTVTLLGGASGNNLEIDGTIEGSGSIEVLGSEDNVTFTNASNSFNGFQADNGSFIFIGTGSVGAPGDLDSGPLGTGMVTLEGGSTLSTTTSSPIELDNAICLPGGTVGLLDQALGTLTLGGHITGSGGFEVHGANGGSNTITFLDGSNTFSGGVDLLDDGTGTTLLLTTSSSSDGSIYQGPLGTGMLTMHANTNLVTQYGDCYELDNAICLPDAGNALLFEGQTNTGMLTLGGAISGQGGLTIYSNDELANKVVFTNQQSSWSGGLWVDAGENTIEVTESSVYSGSTLTSGPLGIGTITMESGSSLTTSSGDQFNIGNAFDLYGGKVEFLPGGMGTLLTLTGQFTGEGSLELTAAGCSGQNTYVFTNGSSTFNGGLTVDQGNTVIEIGGTSVYCGSTFMSGPLGTGMVTLQSGNSLTTAGAGSFELGNSICLPDEGSIPLMTDTMGTELTLTGQITGQSSFDIAAAGCSGQNVVAFTNPNSTFSGGVTVDEGNTVLLVGASSSMEGNSVISGPLGTGTVMFSNGNTLSVTDDENQYSIGNQITLCGGGTLNVMSDTFGGNLLLSGMISGSESNLILYGSEDENPNILTLTSGCSTFSSGVSVNSGNATLIVGASSTTTEGNVVTQGPLGTGTLMLSNGNNFTVTNNGSFLIANAITLCEGTEQLLGNTMNGTLDLSGMISGSGLLDVQAAACGSNQIELDSSCSTFGGGVTLEDGNTVLVVGNSGTGSAGPLGTGTLTLGNGTVLTTQFSNSITLFNPIVIGTTGSCATATVGGAPGATLTLNGSISDVAGNGALAINGSTALNACNTYGGGTNVTGESTVLSLGNDHALSTGPVSVSGATLNFTSSNPVVNDLLLANASTVNFLGGDTLALVDPQGDSPGDNNVINLGSDDPNTLEIQVDSQTSLYTTINGNGNLYVTTNSGGVLKLMGNNSYPQGTVVGSNVLLVAGNNNALGTGQVDLSTASALGVDTGITITNPISMSDGSALGGYGTINSTETLTIQNGSLFTGGVGTIATNGSGPLIVGSLTFGPSTILELGSGGGMQFSIMNASGTPGVDFSQVLVQGTLNITATNADPFLVQIVGVDATGLIAGSPANINVFQPYTWTLISATNTITGNLNPNAFSIDTSFFPNASAGNFYITETGNSIDLNFTPVPEPSTWALVAIGILGLGAAAVRRRRRA